MRLPTRISLRVPSSLRIELLPTVLLAVGCGGEGITAGGFMAGGNGSVGNGGSSLAGGGQVARGGNTSGPQGGTSSPSSGGSSTSGGTNISGTASVGGTPSSFGGTTSSSGGVTASSGGTSSTSGGNGGAARGGTANGGSGPSGGSASAGKGGTTNSGGTAGRGGSSTGTGGNAGRGGNAAGGSSSGGSPGSGGSATGGTTASNGVFSQCRFHFGTIDARAKAGGSALISQLDFFTPGWMLGNSFDQGYVCTDTNPGGPLANQVPVVVTYIAAAYVKRSQGLCDCNVTSCGANNDLCHQGAQQIAQNITAIANAYRSYSQGYASCYGTTRPIIFAMEPDWYQYTASTQTQAWTAAQAGQYMGQLVAALKSSLPNARFSMDVSPWVGPSNGTDNGAQWFSSFDMAAFTFVSTSGGGTNANTAKIRTANNMTWAGLSQVSGKPILADTGYGANGSSAGHDANWDSAANINARIADGVVSINQYNPNSSWGSTISSVRGQLSAPKFCP